MKCTLRRTTPERRCAIQTNGRIPCLKCRMCLVEVCVWPPKVTKQFSTIPGMWRHCPQCPMATLHAEDGVHTTVRHPNRNSIPSDTVSATPNAVVVGGVWPPKVTNQCPAIPGAWGHCPKAHGGPSCRRWCAPHRTTRIRAVEYGVGSAVHDCCGVLVAHSSSQAVEYTPQGPWALALVPLAGSTISRM